ncbi:hypothetical protein Naga_102491g1 [Nannochloropsis gaditana]|uniref:Uncharacterized protein n=1 Tax=Nannochloropsis gaditana TaxID=72520 RepID=W7SYP8_9STRA|nr:hypothetical protein Naga_102491g1 [Nannochloropsis gaditana]
MSLLFYGAFYRNEDGIETTKIDIKTEGSEGNVGIEEEEIELSHPVLLRAVQILRPDKPLISKEDTVPTEPNLSSFLLSCWRAEGEGRGNECC